MDEKEAMQDDRLPGIGIDVPARPCIQLRHLVIDFNGTMAFDGKLIASVEEKIISLSKYLYITVLTADTYGTARKALERLPVTIQVVTNGAEKSDVVTAIKSSNQSVVAIGNGNNDVEMFRVADFSIAVLGCEGLAQNLLRVCTIVAPNIQNALDLLLETKRIIATLRS